VDNGYPARQLGEMPAEGGLIGQPRSRVQPEASGSAAGLDTTAWDEEQAPGGSRSEAAPLPHP
jgi:hypothetical protein